MTENVLKGNVLKDHEYLKKIKENIKGKDEHPYNKGVLMQAHHLISEKGIKKSGLGKELKNLGYDINKMHNVVMIPSTLQGACHLSVQPHRGNHLAPLGQQPKENDDDGQKEMEYHDLVAKEIRDIKRLKKGVCPATDAGAVSVVQSAMEALSKQLLALIQKQPTEAPLTNVAKYFAPGHRVGCDGVDNIPLRGAGYGNKLCPVGRNHQEKQGPGQNVEDIKCPKQAYQLKLGE